MYKSKNYIPLKNFLKITIIILIFILIGFWSPWTAWNINLSGFFGVSVPEKIAGLQVFSLLGEMEVLIDSEKVGDVTVENSPLIVDKVQPGERLVTLKRKTEVSGAYWNYSGVISFAENSEVIIAYGLGPEKEFSEGHIIFVSNKIGDNQENLVVTTNIETPSVLVDGTQIQSEGFISKTNINFDNQHTLVISKPGYEETTFKILPESAEERAKLKDSIINVDVVLMTQPVTVE